MKLKYKHAFMKTAETFAELSSAKKLKVGAIIVKNDRIISIGFNGTPAGWDNTCEDIVVNPDSGEQEFKTRPEVLHAESNCISKLAKSDESGDGATMFITHSPCMECAKLIYQAGIRTVYYKESYRCNKGIDFLIKCGITVEQLKEFYVSKIYDSNLCNYNQWDNHRSY